MLDLAQAVREQIVKETPPRKGERPKTFTLAGLRRLATWGATAAAALLIAVMTSRSEVGAQRIAQMLHGGRPPAQQAFDAQAETQRLAEAVRGLAADDSQIKSRLAAVEHDITDVTGSISKEIEAADAARPAAPASWPTAAATAAVTMTMIAPPHPAAAMPFTARPSADGATRAGSPTEYAVDVGSGLTIEALRARWLALYSAHPQLFEGMKPIVGVKEVPILRGNRVELRLVVGPIGEAAAATQLCASLTQLGLFCQPTFYEGQRFALR
jgi:hypothetical protein